MEMHFEKIQKEFDMFYKEFLTMTPEDLKRKYRITGGIDGYIDVYIGDSFEYLQEVVITLRPDNIMFVDMANVAAKDENGIIRVYSVDTPTDISA